MPAVDKTADQSLITSYDIHLIAEGAHYRLYEKMGAHVGTLKGVKGTFFAVWAPAAELVSVVGDFNSWDDSINPMELIVDSGIWTCFIPKLTDGAIYKYRIRSKSGGTIEKSDPFAFQSEVRPKTASVVSDLDAYKWNDKEWMANRAKTSSTHAPISIYEVHLGSWKRSEKGLNGWLTYRELAKELTEYVVEMGFTHVEFLPIAEHPLDLSWGYQVISYFAPTSRFGTPEEFMYLVDCLHQANIGVIIDWVPSHFPRDGHGLGVFDGTHLYEHADPRQGEHKEWGTYVFNYGRFEVEDFLTSNAFFWFDKFHIDGLRVDAVSSMLYLDYGRKDGEWVANSYGGRENLEAVTFLKRLNERVYKEYPDALMIAEESTAWPSVSRPTYLGGLGFGYKWDMGWMHDTLDYFSQEPIFRKYHHNKLTFRGIYAFSENFVLSLSHDEVVYGKRSLLNKMPGDDWQKFANLRLLYSYMFTLPGKKLLFMGGDIGQWNEWNHDASLDWHLLDNPLNKGVNTLLKDLNKLYTSEIPLHEHDCEPEGFRWLDCQDIDQSILSYVRRGEDPNDVVLVVCNFTPVPRHNYIIGAPEGGFWKEMLNSDATEYGGSGVGNYGGTYTNPISIHGFNQAITVTLPPLGAVIFKHQSEHEAHPQTHPEKTVGEVHAPPADK
jgi:1,4-alpha-glucan branching enzyme